MFVAVVVVCFWRSSWLAFLILTYYIKLMHQFLTPLSYLLWRLSYRSYRIFWKRLFAKNNFWVFLSVPHLLDNYAKIVDGRGRNFMCHRTLPSRLVKIILGFLIFLTSHIWGLHTQEDMGMQNVIAIMRKPVQLRKTNFKCFIRFLLLENISRFHVIFVQLNHFICSVINSDISHEQLPNCLGLLDV